MEQTVAKNIYQVHLRLRRKYYTEMSVFLLILALYLFSLTYYFVFHNKAVLQNPWILFFTLTPLIIYVVFLFFYVPGRFKMLQKFLLLTYFNEGRKIGILLIPNPKGDQKFNYEVLFRETNIHDSAPYETLSAYEFGGRLIHLLQFKKDEGYKSIIHIPQKESPYYLQINNGNFAPTTKYKEAQVSKVSFVSPYNLNYYATSGPTNVKIYLRRELETRFINLVDLLPHPLNYVATYAEEFLVILNFKASMPLKLLTKYHKDYYFNSYKSLITLQNILAIMLEKGK